MDMDRYAGNTGVEVEIVGLHSLQLCAECGFRVKGRRGTEGDDVQTEATNRLVTSSGNGISSFKP